MVYCMYYFLFFFLHLFFLVTTAMSPVSHRLASRATKQRTFTDDIVFLSCWNANKIRSTSIFPSSAVNGSQGFGTAFVAHHHTTYLGMFTPVLCAGFLSSNALTESGCCHGPQQKRRSPTSWRKEWAKLVSWWGSGLDRVVRRRPNYQ